MAQPNPGSELPSRHLSRDLHGEQRIALNRRIFVNRTLNLNSIKVVGFDMDYTLVQYDEDRVEEKVFELSARFMVEHRGYSDQILKLKFIPGQVMRGLVVDKKLGNLLKVNRFGYIKSACHKDRFLSMDEQKSIYANETVSMSDRRYDMIHTSFSLSLASLYCQLIDQYHPHKTYEQLYEDCTDAVDSAHRTGVLKKEIVTHPNRYVRSDPEYAKTLQMLRAFDKKLTLITNSEWEFMNAMMSHSYDPYLPEGETWRDLFDVVISSAAKPAFFLTNNKFFEVMPENGFLKNVTGEIERGKIYQGGNAEGIERMFGVQSGEVLYIGDHVFSDVIQSKKSNQWRTMLVLTELEEELHAAHVGRQELAEIEELMGEKEQLELQLDQVIKQQRIKDASYLAPPGVVGFTQGQDPGRMDDSRLKATQSELREKMKALDSQVAKRVEDYNSRFNPRWGEILFAGNDKSSFGVSIERFACVYTSKVSNLLFYSPVHYFRPKIKNYF